MAEPLKKNRKSRLYAHVTEDERHEVVTLARQARLTVSNLIRRLVLGQKLPDVHRHEAVIELVKINADQARLGNLLRMALDDPEFVAAETPLEELFDNIRTTQNILKAKIKELR
jgi:hypothetical protein